MKYWGPINSPGGIDGNDPYINGNPSIGVQGSIPTFQSFEQTLRALQNLILKNAMNPDATMDDLQVTSAIRSQRTNWTTLFGGTDNALTATFDPAPTALANIVGMPIRGLVRYNNTGPVTLTTNELLEKPVVHPDGTPLVKDDLVAGAIAGIMYDGINYQLIEGWRGAGGGGTEIGTTPPGGGGGPPSSGGFDVLTQPHFFGFTSTGLPRLVYVAPSGWTYPIKNIGDATLDSNGRLYTGPNTSGNWLLTFAVVPPQPIAANKMGVIFYSHNPLYLGRGYSSGIAAAAVYYCDWNDGFTNHSTLTAIVNCVNGELTVGEIVSQYSQSAEVYWAGIRVSGGPVVAP